MDESADPAAGLHEIERLHRQLRRKGRWSVWVWLAIAVATPAFFIGTNLDDGEVRFAIALGFCALALVLIAYSARQQVMDRVAARMERPVTVAYVALVLAVVVAQLAVIPDGFSWGLAVAGGAPAVPCLIGGWRVLRG